MNAVHPSETWNLRQLARYVTNRLDKIKRLGRRTSVETHRFGHALFIVQQRTKPTRQWTNWLTKHNISRQAAWEAIRLYESASEEEVAGLTITEAKLRYSIYSEFMLDDGDAEETTGTRESNVDPEHQVDILYRRLKGAAEVVGELHWQTELLYSTEVDEILQFCRQVVRAISNQRKKVRQPKRENTKPYLDYLRSL
jgi:hypothetical protein